MNIFHRIVNYGSPQWKESVLLRERVLRIPLGSTFSNEELETERDHVHVGSIHNEKIIGTAVLVPEKNVVKVQRVAVEENYRNKGIGGQLMRYCENYAVDRLGAGSIYCHARHTAVQFYQNLGYQPSGDYFDEDGIPHVKMIRQLPTEPGTQNTPKENRPTIADGTGLLSGNILKTRVK